MLTMQAYIPHQTLIYLLSCLAFILLPHLQRAPVVLPAIWLVACFWQYKFFKQQWSLPAWPVKTGLMILAVISVWMQFQSVLSLEFVTQLLLVTLLLKLLEMKSQRDVLILLYLSYFSVVTQLLFSQNIVAGFYVLIALTGITACLISLYQTPRSGHWHGIKFSIKMTAVSIPLLIIAFIVFPRLDPFWSVPKASEKGKTGISDSMSPGSFSELLESNELALRVIFKGKLPDKSQLYWRTLVLDYFDGVTWKATGHSQSLLYQTELPQPFSSSELQTLLTQYKIIQEPTQQPWLFSLDTLKQASRGNYNQYHRTLAAKQPITSRIQYELSSHIQPLQPTSILSQQQRRLNTELPPGYNPKTREFSQQFRLQFNNDEAFINGLLNKITRDNFFYTLKPPSTGKHSVDDFWFSTQSGLCEHYSQALTVILRASDIPARVVTGYQGGFLNPYDNYIMVREKDAHAWVEAWIANKGWLRIDPTFAISPERIQSGAMDNTNMMNRNTDSNWGGSHSALSSILKLQLKWDQINFFWQQKILNFNDTIQLQLLEKLLGSTSYLRIALFIVLSFFGVSVAFFIFTYLQQQSHSKVIISPEIRLYNRFIRQLEKLGIDVRESEGPNDLSHRLKRLIADKSSDDQLVSMIKPALLFLQLYLGLQYQPVQSKEQKDKCLVSMKRELKKFR